MSFPMRDTISFVETGSLKGSKNSSSDSEAIICIRPPWMKDKKKERQKRSTVLERKKPTWM
jgi:hypothetical protein